MSSRDEWRRRLRANLEESWKRGNPVAAEKVVAGAQPFPVTADDLLDLLLCEAKLCRDAGQFPDLQEFIQRAPQLAAAWHARLRDDPEALKVFGDLHATSAHIDQLISTNFDASTGFDTPRSQPADNFASLDAGRDASRLHAFADPGAPAVDPHETRAWGGDVHDPEATRAPDTKSPAGQASDVQPRRVDTDPHATAGDVNELAPTLDLEPGWAMVPGYEILGELGRGGMGVVYKASQAKLRRIVALKMILAGSRADQIELTRFQREAEAVARLQHPNIVQIYEVGEHEGKPFFSLEFVDGGSLAHQLKENLQTPRKTAETMLQLAEAMHVAHERGIVHRDLKPANILVTRDGVPKITDFGLAKNLEEDFGETRSGQVMGTPSYMSPEQASGQIDRIGPATDVYALGAILYEMLSGRPPFKGTTLLDLLSQVRNEEPIAPRRVQPKVPYDLETICLRCLQKEPGKRYASAQALAADLRRYLNGEPIEARRTPLWERTIKYVRRSPWVAGFWGLVALGLIAGSFWGVGSVYQRIHQSNLYVEAQKQLLELQNEISKQKDKGWQDANWQQAAALMSGVQGMIRTEPALSSLQATANQLQEELTREQAAKKSHEEGSKAARDTYQGFRAELNKAMINQLQNVGLRQQANLEAVRQAAPAALARYDVTLDSKGQPRTDNPYLTESERASILPGCYELLLAWAHATAHPLRDKGEDDFVQARKALAILARARSLGLDTRAYHMRRGTYLLILGDKKEAQQELEQARNMEPRTATDNYLVGAELFDTLPALQEPARTQAYRQAIQYLQRAVELRPEHYWANFSLGRIYLQSARPDAAVARLTACIQQQPEFLWAYPLRAHAHGMLKEYDAAEADYALAEKLPDDEVRYSVFVNRGLMYFNQGQDLRIRHAKQAQDHFARAIGQYHQAIALQPNQYQAHVNLAQLYQTQGRLGDALENLDRAIELHDRDASLYRTRGLLQLRCGNEQAALDDLDRAIALAPPGKSANLAADFIERGRILFRRKRYDAALESFEQAQRFHPEEFPRAHRLRAEALLELGQHTEALQAINRNLTRGGDDDHDAYLTRGLIRSKLARYHEAIADYTLALDAPPAKGTDPAEIDKIRAKTLAYRGWAYLILDAIRVAEHDFDEALKLDDQNGDAHSGRGNARIKQGKHESALVDIEASLKLGKPSSRLSYNAARCYALAVDAVGKNAAFDRAKLAQAQFYQSRALDLLRAALDQVPEAERAAFIKDYVETDPAWLALRRNSRFAEIVASGSR